MRARFTKWPANLHGRPPLTPAGVLLRFRITIPVLVSVFVLLAIAAAVDRGSLLLNWDEPVTRALMDVRSPGLDGIVKALSSLGGLTVVVLVLVLLLLLVWHECRSLALVLLAASVARPLLEWSLKELVDRPRPDLGQLVAGTGPSFPTGHVMAAFAVWGLLPPVVALVSGRRAAWWWSVGSRPPSSGSSRSAASTSGCTGCPTSSAPSFSARSTCWRWNGCWTGITGAGRVPG